MNQDKFKIHTGKPADKFCKEFCKDFVLQFRGPFRLKQWRARVTHNVALMLENNWNARES